MSKYNDNAELAVDETFLIVLANSQEVFSVVPTGLWVLGISVPSDKSLGYYRKSLRDKDSDINQIRQQHHSCPVRQHEICQDVTALDSRT